MLYQVLNAVSDGVFKEMFNGEIIFHLKKETEKIMLSQLKGLRQIIVKLRIEKKYMNVSIIHHTSLVLRETKY